MVRLKGGYGVLDASDRVKFQFQYGSIKRVILDFIYKILYVFQFQYGSIKSRF